MKVRLTLAAFVATLAAVVVIAPAAPAATQEPAASSTSALTTPVTGTITDAIGGTVSGVLSITGFDVQNGQLVAVGTLTATLTDLAGNVIGTVTQTVTIPVAATGSCPILHLELGPLDLNLLGLMVHLDRVVLDITAQSGPGNLLGNLLCAVAHLLDSNAPLGSLAGLLNRILRLLG